MNKALRGLRGFAAATSLAILVQGAVLLVAWLAGSTAVLVFGILSGELAQRTAWWLDRVVF